jgi:hypothetical protein
MATTDLRDRARRLGLSTPGRIAGVLAAVLTLQALVVAALVLPGHKPEPHDVPLGVVGPPALAQQIEQTRPGAFDVTTYPDEAAARAAIDERDVYGAVVADGAGERLLVASAASNSVAQLLRTSVAASPDVAVEDVRPLTAEDPRGSTINLMFMPLVITCFSVVMLLTHLELRRRVLLSAIGVFALLAGLAVTGFVGEGLGALPGDYLSLAGVAALTVLAVALPTAGFVRLLGAPGLGVSVLLFFLVGNPSSGNASAPEMLPDGWRHISQLMPPGAGGSALRNVAYFDGNALLQPVLVLTTYALFGALLVVAADLVRRRRTADEAVADLPPQATATGGPAYA